MPSRQAARVVQKSDKFVKKFKADKAHPFCSRQVAHIKGKEGHCVLLLIADVACLTDFYFLMLYSSSRIVIVWLPKTMDGYMEGG